MTNQDAVRKEISRLLASQLLTVLATQRDGQPYTSLLAYAARQNLAEIFLVTDRKTAKYKNILSDNRVSLLVDDRANQAIDFTAAAAVTIIGVAEELKGPEQDEAREIFLGRHPSLEEFAVAPATALLKIVVSRYILVRRFQNAMVLDMGAA